MASNTRGSTGVVALGATVSRPCECQLIATYLHVKVDWASLALDTTLAASCLKLEAEHVCTKPLIHRCGQSEQKSLTNSRRERRVLLIGGRNVDYASAVGTRWLDERPARIFDGDPCNGGTES